MTKTTWMMRPDVMRMAGTRRTRCGDLAAPGRHRVAAKAADRLTRVHELAITRSIVASVSDAAHGRTVTRVTVAIGKLSGVMPDAVAFCFDIAAQGTVLEGAVLQIEQIPGRGRCRDCGRAFPVETLFTPCACGSHAVALLQGEELTVKSMEVEAPG